jgi:hypothetical protein
MGIRLSRWLRESHRRGRRGLKCSWASTDFCCDYLNAFTDRAAAKTRLTLTLRSPGDIVDGTDAERLGRIFGDLLS